MNLLRKMSGLRSSSDFSKENDSASAENELAESPSDRNGEEEEVESGVLTDPKLDDGDLFEDAAAALPGQQQPRQQQPDENLDPRARIEQPAVLDELDLDDEVSVRGGEEEVEDDGDDDGRGSHGSGESFDSALERMAALSEASYDGSLSPRISSPVGSVPDGIGNNPQNLRVFQEGALLRLNEMVSGDPSLDTSLIDNSTEQEFKSLVSQTAKSRGQSLEDSSFASIVDALLPLVIEKSEGKTSDLDCAELGDDVDPNSIEASNVDIEQSKPQSPMPQAQLTAEDESFAELEGGTEDAAARLGALENGGEDIEDVKAQSGQGEEVQDHAHLMGKGPIKSVGTEQESNGNSNFVPHSNGGHEDGLGQVPLTQARYVSEDEELGDDGQSEEHREEPVDETAGAVDTKDGCLPSQVSSVPSDLDDSLVPPQSTPESPTQESDEIGNNDENSVPADVHISSKQGEENQTGPVGKLSEDDVQSPQNQSEALSASSEVIPQDLPAEESEGTEVNNSVDEGGEEEHKSAQIPAEDEEEGEAKTSLLNGDDAEEGDQEEEGEAETSLLNGDDAEEGDEEEKEEDEDSFMRRMIRNAEPASSDEEESAPPAPSLGSAGPSLPARPTRPVRSSLPSLEPAARAPQQPRSGERATIRSSSSATESQANDEPADGNEETREKLQSIRIKFLRLALRLGQSAHNVVVAQVLYRLGLAEQLRGGRGNNRNTAFSFDRASAIAEEQERAAGPEELDFACTIMMLGKTGVGKSATINSIFDEAKTGTNAFSPATNKVQVITGHVHGIKVRVIDTPGLLPSVVDQRHNERIMASVKGFIKKQSPDIVLYFDRLDMQSRDYGDLPLLRTITDTFGAAVWFNAIVVLTHASSAPPDGPNGLPLSYEMFVAQRSHVVQQTIRQAAGDMRLMNPVSLVENHRACRVNRSGESVLPNGQVWKPQLLLLCFASKILAEANSLLKLQDNSPGKPFGQRSRVPPLPFLLSSLLQSRTPLKLPDEQVGDEDESDEELEEGESSDEEEDYDQLPPFRRLSKEEIAELDGENRANYYEELGERERLFQKKQWKEELKRRMETKKRMAEAPTDQSQFGPEDGLEEEATAAVVPVPMPDMVLPPSFDSDNPSHRYRYLETANQWLVRPVLETHGWDHDNGYDGMNVEKMFVMGTKMPVSVSGQITKDKKEANLSLEAAASLKHGEDKVTLAGLDVQTVGKDLGYTLRSETRFNNFKGNKTTGGLAVTLLGDTVSAGMKIEDRLLLGKRLKLVVNGGAITGGGDIAYGGSLEATLRGKEFPFSRTLSTLGVSIMDWHNDLAVGGNFQSQFMLGKTMMVGRANLNNRGAGQISIRASSSDQLQMTLIGIIPIVRAIANRLFGDSQ
ncbi:unnamed protein product [Calypogeia fissa]